MKTKNEFENVNFLLFLWKFKWWIGILSILAFILAAVFSGPMFITPKYKSQVILFPASTSSVSKAILSQGVTKDDILKFGEDEDAEQLLQILNSNIIREKIIAKYNLMEHYEIDSNATYKYTNLFREYSDNIQFSRTEYMAVQISVLDEDPKIASAIANDISMLLDSTKIAMQKERAIIAFHIVENEYLILKNEIKRMEDSLAILRSLGINDYESQAEMMNRQLAIELARNSKSAAVKALEAKLDILSKYGTPYVSIRDQLEYDKKHLTELKTKYEQANVDATTELPQSFVVDRAFPAEKKSYPVRWVICVMALISTFVLSIIVLLILENFKRLGIIKGKE